VTQRQKPCKEIVMAPCAHDRAAKLLYSIFIWVLSLLVQIHIIHSSKENGNLRESSLPILIYCLSRWYIERLELKLELKLVIGFDVKGINALTSNPQMRVFSYTRISFHTLDSHRWLTQMHVFSQLDINCQIEFLCTHSFHSSSLCTSLHPPYALRSCSLGYDWRWADAGISINTSGEEFVQFW
jgi:hypothetical protein